MARIELKDASLDIWLRCRDCGKEFCFNYAGAKYADTVQDLQDAEDAFIRARITEVEFSHECPSETPE